MNDVNFFFGGWAAIGRVIVVGTAMYASVVVLLRFSGSRTLASMNAFDFIVTVAIGSAFGRALTAKGVAFAEAIVAFMLLIGLQFVVARLQTRWPSFANVVTNPPVLLYFQGEFLHESLVQQRVTESEIMAAVRKQQSGSIEEVEAVIMESSGAFSVIQSLGNRSALGYSIEGQIERLARNG